MGMKREEVAKEQQKAKILEKTLQSVSLEKQIARGCA